MFKPKDKTKWYDEKYPRLRALVPEVMTLSYVIGTPLSYLVLLPRLRILWDCLGIRVGVGVVVGVLCTPWDKVNNMLARR